MDLPGVVYDLVTCTPAAADGSVVAALMRTCKGLRARGEVDLARFHKDLMDSITKCDRFLKEDPGIVAVLGATEALCRRCKALCDSAGIFGDHDDATRMMHLIAAVGYLQGPPGTSSDDPWHLASSFWTFPDFVRGVTKRLGEDYDASFLEDFVGWQTCLWKYESIFPAVYLVPPDRMAALAAFVSDEVLPFYRDTWTPLVRSFCNDMIDPLETALKTTFCWPPENPIYHIKGFLAHPEGHLRDRLDHVRRRALICKPP
jgi:hypothetical protein